MKRQRYSIFLIKILVCVLVHLIAISAQDAGSIQRDKVINTEKLISDDIYQRVLDIVFQDKEVNKGDLIYSFVLRFKPYSEPESQIIIRKRASKSEIIEFTSENGIIFNTLNDYFNRTNNSDPMQLAKIIKVKKRILTVSNPQLKKWHTTFFQGVTSTNETLYDKGSEFDRTGSETIFLHGGYYELWYGQSLNNMSFKLYDVDIKDAEHDAIYTVTKWMSGIRRTVEKLK